MRPQASLVFWGHPTRNSLSWGLRGTKISFPKTLHCRHDLYHSKLQQNSQVLNYFFFLCKPGKEHTMDGLVTFHFKWLMSSQSLAVNISFCWKSRHKWKRKEEREWVMGGSGGRNTGPEMPGWTWQWFSAMAYCHLRTDNALLGAAPSIAGHWAATSILHWVKAIRK